MHRTLQTNKRSLEDIAAIFGDVVEHPGDPKEECPVDHVEKSVV